MDWKVVNAVNRDVERQHLNKILQDVRSTITGILQQVAQIRAQNGNSDIHSIVGEMVSNNSERGISVSYNPQAKTLDFAANDFVISLVGDVVGTATVNALSGVVIDTEVQGILKPAPDDGHPYWQKYGDWEAVPVALEEFETIEGEGIVVHREGDDAGFYVVEIEGTDDEIEVADGNGVGGNPTISLADLTDTGNGTFKLIERDAKGRVSGSADGDSDDVSEGDTNLYFTDERAQDAVGAAIATGVANGDSDGAELGYDDTDGSIYVTNLDKGSDAVSAHESALDPHPQYLTADEIPPSGVPYFVEDGDVFVVPANKQVLFTLPIVFDGDSYIQMDGILVEVN